MFLRLVKKIVTQCCVTVFPAEDARHAETKGGAGGQGWRTRQDGLGLAQYQYVMLAKVYELYDLDASSSTTQWVVRARVSEMGNGQGLSPSILGNDKTFAARGPPETVPRKGLRLRNTKRLI
jgi:hypothetical protein